MEKNNFEKKKLLKQEIFDDTFECDICQDQGCQNCQGEYRQNNDILTQEQIDAMRLKDMQEAEDKKIVDDGLSFICEYCQDTEGGCPQCGFGAKQARNNR